MFANRKINLIFQMGAMGQVSMELFARNGQLPFFVFSRFRHLARRF